VLLQVLDDGRMTDGKGRTVDFRNTIMIMTSNLGSDLIMKMAENQEGEENIKNQIEEILHQQFKPEFLNRIDETIIFHSLSKEDMSGIIDIQLKRLKKRLQEKKISLEIGEKTKTFLIDSGYNPLFGARPLKRAIQRHLEDPLAMELLEGNFTEGSSIEAIISNEAITFTKK
jgi:ATP-dependent Clp protease ATP-binding subunit ClpB